MRRLTQFLSLLFTQPLDEQVRFEFFFEICYKFGFIHCPNVNETFELDYPDYLLL